MAQNGTDIWLAAGVRTPFTRVDGALAKRDAIGLSVPVARAMVEKLSAGTGPDLMVWGAVAPNLTYSNIAREIWLDAGLDPAVPAFSTILACSTSMVAVFEAAGMLRSGSRDLALAGGAESMSRVQLGLSQGLSDTLRRLAQARDMKGRVDVLRAMSPRDVRLHIPSVSNRTTGKSMGEHCEETAKEWKIGRAEQDQIAFASHQNAVAAAERGFFDDLILPVDDTVKDAFPRKESTLEKLGSLKPAFDRKSGQGTLTAGNCSPLTDGAAGIWVATEAGLDRVPKDVPRVKLLDWEIAAVDLRTEGLLMAPAYAIPRLLARNSLGLADIGLWEIHEAFAAQVLSNIAAIESAEFVNNKAGVSAALGSFPRENLNPNGGSVALGHPFGATGARILSQATKELAAMEKGTRAVVSICADGGLGTVALLESA